MKKRLRRSLWGLQWIFLKTEKSRDKSMNRGIINLSPQENSVASDLEDFPQISLAKLEDNEPPPIKVNKVSTRDKYKMTHIDDLPNLSYKKPHIRIESNNENWLDIQKQSFERKAESSKHSRPKTVEIRRLVLPEKHIRRIRKPEHNNSANRRKHYGKWFIPPEKWKNSLDHFLSENHKIL